MDQYPDENEEYELLYQDELEMLDEFPADFDENYMPIEATQTQNKSLAQLKKQNDTPLQSPQLSQILCTQDDFGPGSKNARAIRRLFGTPVGPQRGSSTPLANKKGLEPIAEIISSTEDAAEPPIESAAEELQNIGLRTKRRLDRDLFGNIDDIYLEEMLEEDPAPKKQRTDEERDYETIDKILELRRRVQDNKKSLQKDMLTSLQAVHDFKMKNLSYKIPKWPFMPFYINNMERIYVRYHSAEYEQNAIDRINFSTTSFNGFLGENKEKVWAAANDIVLRRTALTEVQPPASDVVATTDASDNSEKCLWVEKYKPRKYIDLLSDEMTNRSLLFWLRMWDKIVFGREFNPKEERTNTRDLNTFNKRTGRFESNGGWQRKRKQASELNRAVDELGRPMQKVALLCGPPGLGKTTLAHTIARHAGYEVREINASDDRSPEAFKLALENGTQMSSVLNRNRRPNCIVLDEIDGAPRQSIDFLVKFVTDNVAKKTRSKDKKHDRTILRRPVICICNDLYSPALRALRQIAFVVTFPPIDPVRLTERLLQIAEAERLTSDFSALIALAEKSGNDVRSCIATMQFFNVEKKALTLHDVLSNNIGQKDRHHGLFEIWTAVFQIPRPKKQLEIAPDGNGEQEITMTNMSSHARVQHLLSIVHSGGDYDILMQGVHENYLHQKMPDPNLKGIVEANQWFCFTDTLNQHIHQLQNYTVYPYLQYGFAIWHLLFAALPRPRISFPIRSIEFNQKSNTQKNIFQAFRRSISPAALGIGQGSTVLLDTVPLAKRIVSPNLRSVAIQLLTSKEKADLKHAVEVMIDLGLSYTQVKSVDGAYIFQLEPNIELLLQFFDTGTETMSYFSRQVIARETELERIRRAVPKWERTQNKVLPQKSKEDAATKSIPNHLRKLQPKQLVKKSATDSDAGFKDFFGRIQRKETVKPTEEAKNDTIVQSPVWYRFKEGFNNAVRKDIRVKELM